MNSSNRLLFAAARGARIENHRGLEQKYLWLEPFDNDLFRIHPDDEALQYGPISTALREMANSMSTPRCNIIYDTLAGIAPYLEEAHWEGYDNELHRSLFLLILAEALADEGL